MKPNFHFIVDPSCVVFQEHTLGGIVCIQPHLLQSVSGFKSGSACERGNFLALKRLGAFQMEQVYDQVLDTPREMVQALFCLGSHPSAFEHQPTLDALRMERQRRRRRHQTDSCCLDRFAQIIQKYLEAQFA